MSLPLTMLRFSRIMSAMEEDCGPSEHPTTLTIHSRRWYHSWTRGLAWEREWAGIIR